MQYTGHVGPEFTLVCYQLELHNCRTYLQGLECAIQKCPRLEIQNDSKFRQEKKKKKSPPEPQTGQSGVAYESQAGLNPVSLHWIDHIRLLSSNVR